jgi:hypothetical protein
MTYTLYNPNGKKVTITNLYRYCRRYGLDYPSMREVAIDQRIEYKGWKKTPNRIHRRKNYYRLIGPNGELVEGVSIRQLSLARGLSYRSMCALVRREIKTCCGYRRADMDERTATTHRGKDHVLLSPQGKETLINNIKAFCREHGLSYDSMRKGYESKGWRYKR